MNTETPSKDDQTPGPDDSQSKGPDEADRGPRFREIPRKLLIPNSITVLAVCAGLTGIRLAYEGNFELAVTMVLVAAFLDGIDGRVARLLKAQTNFGAQLDSLADVINFGVAPALVLHAFILHMAPSFGWVAALLYAIANALRLARFNVMLERQEHQSWEDAFFLGVPAPLGALLVLLPVYLGFLGLEPSMGFAVFSALYTGVIAFLLISRVPVFSGKEIGQGVRRDLFLPLILLVVLYVWLLVSFTWQTMAFTSICYLISLPIGAYVWSKRYGSRSALVDDNISLNKKK